jgi:hypothetical protein
MTEPTIEIGVDGETIPTEEVLTGRGFAFGKSGGGKSNSVSVVVEELLEDGHACLIVDPDGEYYGLKEEYEVLHATGSEETGDLKVGVEHADRLAELALVQNVPVVLDTSGFLDGDVADELVGKVARALFAKAQQERKPFLLVVEECHEYLPQQGSPGFAGEHLTRVAKRGRKHGLGLLGVSQRPANVDKDAVTQASWINWHRLTYTSDTRLVKELYGSDAEAAIQELDPGEALLFTDWSEEDLQRLRWRRKRTFDAGDTPGLEDRERPELRSINQDVLEEIQEAGEAARTKEERIEELEERVEELLDEKADLESEVEQLEERNAWEEQMATRMFDGLEGGSFDVDLSGEGSIKADVMEVYQERQDLEERVEELLDELDERDERIEELEAEVEDLEEYRDRVEQEGEIYQLRDDLEELIVSRYPSLFDGLEADERAERIRERAERQEERIEELEADLERATTGRTPTPEPEDFDDVVQLLRTESVQKRVEKAVEVKSDNSSEETVWQTLVALARAPEPPVHASEIIGSVPIKAEATVTRILSALEEVDLAKSERGSHNRKLYRVDLDELEALVERDSTSEDVQEIGKELATGGSHD